MKRNDLYKGLYNPNRFNAFDSAVVYSALLAVFVVIPQLTSLFLRDFFRALYQYDTYAYLIVNILISQSAILLIAFIWSKIRKTDPFSGGGYFAEFDGVKLLMSVILVMGIMMTFYRVHLQVSDDADFLFGSFDLDINTGPLTPIFALIYIVLSAALPAVIEEMAFRGIIMRGLEQFGTLTAVILSSVAFSLMHGSFNQLILQFLGGFAIGGVVAITKNYLLGCVMHAFNNIYAVVYGLLIQDELAESLQEIAILKVVDMATVIIGIVCLFSSTVYFVKLAIHNINKEKEENKNYGDLIGKKRYVEADKTTSEVRFLPPFVMAEMKKPREEDTRLFAIAGKLRPLNKKAPLAPSIFLFSIAIIFAVAILILQI
ncbi:MAG: CPBP family intramembrane metalloprotease [Clostridia bacterium]|nr:CPBP family intramembrane metalloprotease [Clostridia bacterium]